MSEEQDVSQKTEEATPRKLLEAREKGNVISSQEVSHFAVLLAGALIAAFLGPFLANKLVTAVGGLLFNFHVIDVDAANIGVILKNVILQVGLGMFPLVAVVFIFAIGAKLLVSGFLFSSESLKPSIERISPIKGFSRLFSLKSLIEFLKGIVKLTIVGAIAVLIALPVFDKVELLMQMDIIETVEETQSIITKMFIGVVAIMAIIAALDYMYQRFEYLKQMRMSRQEVKDEFKQSDGDPLVRGRLRQIRTARARARMMAAVPEADVVVTNPTHFAVALKYEMASMNAPRLVAKGADEVALRIRDVANENEVPVVENPPIARALFETADIDDEIPPEHYKAVAEIISYVFKLKNKPLN